MRSMLVALLCALALPAVAAAQDNPFTPLPQAQQPTQTQTTPAPKSNASDPDGGGLSSGVQVLLGVAAVIVLSGVAFLIVRDARRRAPTTDAELRAERDATERGRGTRPSGAARKSASRRRNKAVRTARRHNR